ncbi:MULTISPECIES: 2TM domain-containing protein [Aquimarina]|uniref:2TM domain-containing protein n=1 Tax=Aquimarina algiphila TaxID=2047982 RepID=A0A554VPS5_9FLAO|nr:MULTISPECIES: 2TM domain-containing protein [Aquimarina]TSE10495.1 2TM domain-containing protein [Aquimarina algiphila]
MENFEQQRYEKAKKRVEREKGFYSHLTVYIIINLALLFINSDFIDEGFNNWFQWHLYATPLFWGIGLFFHGVSVFGKNSIFNKEWEKRKIKELMDKDDF